jgi:hypothetical protein
VSVSTAAAPGSYRAPHWHDALLLSLPERWVGARTRWWIRHLPMTLALLAFAALVLRLSNGASVDEALAVNTGRDVIGHWLTGAAATVPADALPGSPYAYPVLAAALDSVGGLVLVRAFGLGCVVLAAVLLQAATAARFPHRAGVLAAAVFLLTGLVVFLAGLGTSDSMVLAMLAAALWLGATRSGTPSAVAAGALLAFVPVVDHVSAVLVPIVVLAGALMAVGNPLRRAALVGLSAAALTVTIQLLGSGAGATAWTALFAGEPSSPLARTTLAGWLVLDVGLLLGVALAGALALFLNGRRNALLAAVLLVGGALLPAAQLWAGEAAAFDQHLAYSALFLAPLAGIALTRLSRRTWRLGPILLLLPVLLLFGASRSGAMYSTWADVRPVVAAILADPRPGLYLASGTAAQPLEYYTAGLPAVGWEDTYGLYARGDDAIRVAVEDLRYETIVLHTASTGSAAEDAQEDVVLTALHDNSSDYELVATIPASDAGDADAWLVYRQVAP